MATSSKKSSSSKKKGGSKGKKGPTAYNVYLKERCAELKKQYGNDTSVIEEAREDWSALSEAQKESYKKKAEAQKEKA